MKYTITEYGFEYVELDTRRGQLQVWQTDVRGDYEDAIDRPNSSVIRVGESHGAQLNREHVAALVVALQTWLRTGHLHPQSDEEIGNIKITDQERQLADELAKQALTYLELEKDTDPQEALALFLLHSNVTIHPVTPAPPGATRDGSEQS